VGSNDKAIVDAQSLLKDFMIDEKQARLEARARIDIKNLYDRGQVTSKDYAAAFRHVKFVWLGDLTDAQIDEFVRKEIRELEPPVIIPGE
jgi:hypothetical protein